MFPLWPMKHNDSWLTSENFLKRCFAIYFHALVAHIIVVTVLFLLWFALLGMFAANHYGMRDARTGRSIDMMQRSGRMMNDYENRDDGLFFERNMKRGKRVPDGMMQ